MDRHTLEKKIMRMERELLALKTAHMAGLGTTRFYCELLTPTWTERVYEPRLDVVLSDELGQTPITLYAWVLGGVAYLSGELNLSIQFGGWYDPGEYARLHSVMVKSSAPIVSATWSHQ